MKPAVKKEIFREGRRGGSVLPNDYSEDEYNNDSP